MSPWLPGDTNLLRNSCSWSVPDSCFFFNATSPKMFKMLGLFFFFPQLRDHNGSHCRLTARSSMFKSSGFSVQSLHVGLLAYSGCLLSCSPLLLNSLFDSYIKYSSLSVLLLSSKTWQSFFFVCALLSLVFSSVFVFFFNFTNLRDRARALGAVQFHSWSRRINGVIKCHKYERFLFYLPY